MDFANIILASNAALIVVTLAGAALTKDTIVQRASELLSAGHLAGAAGALIGLTTVSSVAAMFL